jgi:integrase
MACIFKRGGKKNREGHYIASWFNENGKRVTRSTGTSDYEAATQIAAKWKTETALRKRGVISTSQARVADENQKPIKEHIADYFAHCEHTGQDRVHISNKRTQLGKLITGLGATCLSDLDPHKVERYLAALVTAGKSHRTHNQHRATAVAFAEWLLEQGRIASNRFKIVHSLNEAKDRRMVRRALTEDEMSRLISASNERRPYYLFAYYTGLRVKAVKAAVWGDVDFEAATIRVRVGNAKGKKDDICLPLHSDLMKEVRRIKPHFAAIADPIFPTIPTVRTFHRDCERAGIDRYDADGRQLDRHALRTTLGTNLALAGVMPQMAMKVLGHSDVRITMKHYTALRLVDTAKAVQTLPTVKPHKATKSDAGKLRATGTDGKVLDSAQQKRQQLGNFSRQPGSSLVTEVSKENADNSNPVTHDIDRKNMEFDSFLQPVALSDLKANPNRATIENSRAIGAVG